MTLQYSTTAALQYSRTGFTGFLLGSLLGVHFPLDFVHPEEEISDHLHESEEIRGVSQFLSPAFTQTLELSPSVDHFVLSRLDLQCFVASIRCLKTETNSFAEIS